MKPAEILYTNVPCCLCPAEFVVDPETNEAFCIDCEPERARAVSRG